MDAQTYQDSCDFATLIGQSVGQNIFNPTQLDRLLANAYPGDKIQTDFYVYSAVFLALAAGAAANQNVIIAADSDFVLLGMNAHANIANAGQTENTEVLPLCTLAITDTSSGRTLMDQAQPMSSIMGSARQPYLLPQPRLVPAKTVLQMAVTNFDAANTYNLRLSFIGVKVFNLGPA